MLGQILLSMESSIVLTSLVPEHTLMLTLSTQYAKRLIPQRFSFGQQGYRLD